MSQVNCSSTFLPRPTFFSMIHGNKKGRLEEVLTRLGCKGKHGSCTQNQRDLFYYFFINIFILFLYLVVQRLIEHLGKLLINHLTKIYIFFPIIIRNKKRKRKKRGLARSWLGWVVEVKKAIVGKIKEIFSYFYLINLFSHSKANRGAG